MLVLRKILSIVLFCAVILPSLAAADEFYLASGGQISGQLLNASQDPRTTYEVKTDTGLRLALPEKQVRRFVPTSEARRNYETLLPRMPDDAEGNFKMAQWCRDAGLTEEREFHLREAMRLDPEHRETRLALGYTTLDGEWVLTDEWNRKHGYIYHQGKWMTPHEAEAQTIAQRVEDAQRNWKRQLNMLRGNAAKSLRNRDLQAYNNIAAEIGAIRDPLAGAALAELYADEESPVLRLLWVKALGVNPTGVAIDTIAKAAVEDDSEPIREAAGDALEESKDRRAIGALLAELKSKDNSRVNRAAAALQRISDPETILPLMEALVTEHKFIVTYGPPGSTSATFSPNGGSGFSAGSKTKVETRKVSNTKVLAALRTIVQEHFNSNAHHQYNEESWKAWYAELHAPEVASFRRDP